jgi:DNA-binding MarR family transcriptional regulator
VKKLPFMDEYYNLWLLLSQTRSAVFKARHKKYGQYLHPNQASALVAVWIYDGEATPARLARQLFLEPHSASELVNRMAKKGLVKKSRDTKRGNIVRISITEKGREICTQLIQADFIRGLISKLSDDQRGQLKASLSVLYRAALKELGMEGYEPPYPEMQKEIN